MKTQLTIVKTHLNKHDYQSLFFVIIRKNMMNSILLLFLALILKKKQPKKIYKDLPQSLD